MPKLAVKGLDKVGVVTDISSFEIPINAWTDANNITFTEGGAKKVGNLLEVLSSTPDKVNKFYTKDKRLFYTTDDSVFMHTGAGATDISKGAYVTSNEWYIAELSNVLVFTNSANKPQYFGTNAATLEDLPDWSDLWRTPIIRSYKNFLLALGTTEMGVDYKQRVRWSDIARPNDAPASWDATSTTNSAGFNDLSEAKGDVVDGLDMRDSFMVYTTKEVFSIDYIAGNDIFRFRKALDNVSILAPECVCKVPNGHFVVTSNDIIIHNGSSSQSVIKGRIKRRLFDEIANGNPQLTKVQYYPAKEEVWVCYGESELENAAVFNLSNGTWSFRLLPSITAIHYGVLPETTAEVIDTMTGTMDSYTQTFDGTGKDFVNSSIIGKGVDGRWLALDEPTWSEIIRPAWLVRENIDFDSVGFSSSSIKQIKTIYPQIQGQEFINISVGYSMSPEIPPTWSLPVRFDPRNDYKADFRVDGRYISIKFESFGVKPWKLMGYEIDAMPRGGR